MEIESDEFGVVTFEESFDGAFQLLVIEGVGQGAFDRSLTVVLDAQAIAEGDEQLLLSLHKISLKEVLTDGVAGAELERFVKPCDLLGHRLLFHKDRAELPCGGQAGHGGLVKLAFVFPEPEEHVTHEGGIDLLVNFEGFHGLFAGRE